MFSFKHAGDVRAQYLSYYLNGLTYHGWVVQSTKDNRIALNVNESKGYDKVMGLISRLSLSKFFASLVQYFLVLTMLSRKSRFQH